jgi:hypothetical protein
MMDVAMAVVILILLILPIIFKDKINRAVYLGIGAAIIAFTCTHFKLITPEKNIGQLVLCVIATITWLLFYINGYFIFRSKEVHELHNNK